MTAQHRHLAAGDTLIIASHNAGKVSEIAALLEPYKIACQSAGACGLAEPEETETSFVSNARLKACAAASATGMIALADDSGLCVDALSGAPGIHSARWAGPNRDFTQAMVRIEHALKESGQHTRSAFFVCALALAWPDGHTETFEGKVFGTLVWPPRGDQGFGYDPFFQPRGHDLTFGEMAPARKHSLSHRASAFDQLIRACLGSCTL